MIGQTIILRSPASREGAEWYRVVGYEGVLEITRDGRVRNCDRVVRCAHNSTRISRAKEVTPFMLNTGYLVVQIKRGSKRKNLSVHRMLAEAFIPNPEGKPFVNHIDGNKTNNDLSNLEWVTHAENIRHAFRIGLIPPSQIGPGERSPAAKLTWAKVAEIRKLLADGVSQRAVASMFGVGQSAIGFIARNETWKVNP